MAPGRRWAGQAHPAYRKGCQSTRCKRDASLLPTLLQEGRARGGDRARRLGRGGLVAAAGQLDTNAPIHDEFRFCNPETLNVSVTPPWYPPCRRKGGRVVAIVRGASDEAAWSRLRAGYDSGDPDLKATFAELSEGRLSVYAGELPPLPACPVLFPLHAVVSTCCERCPSRAAHAPAHSLPALQQAWPVLPWVPS